MTLKSLKCVLVFVAFFSASNLYAGVEEDYKAGLVAQNNENYDEAAKWYRKAAEQGHAKAQYQFFRIFYDGRIAYDTNLEVAKKWFKRAAEQGYAEAQYQLAEMHMDGAWMFEVPKDEKEAVNWYRKAAVQGHAKAQVALSYNYLKGKGVPKDTEKSIKWLTKAAEQGHAQSQYFLGSIYNGGKLVPQNEKEAIKWFTRAAEQGHTQSIARLKKLEEKAVKANAEPYQNNDDMIRGMLKGIYGWEVESDKEVIGQKLKAIVGAFKIKGKAKCHPYVVFSVPLTKAAILNVNGVDVRFTAVGRSSFHLYLAALSEAGRNYMLNEFKKKNNVVVAGDKTLTFSAVGFTKGLNSIMNDCEKAAKTVTNAL